MSESDLAKQRHRAHFTPLRYPGGKAKLAEYVKKLLGSNSLLDGVYVEPYAGGAAIALELVLQEYVTHVHINDVSRPIYAFWKSVLCETEKICRWIADKPLTVAQWDREKQIFAHADEGDDAELGFAMFYLNRTNRSGILNAGIIGGRDQTGPWKIDARYNAKELIRRVEAIAEMRERISVTRQDALTFVRNGVLKWPADTLIYLDPPYYVKGRDLYHDYYNPADHSDIAEFMLGLDTLQKWIVSYDNVQQIQALYSPVRRICYSIGYSARSASRGSEVMFFCEDMRVPSLVGPITMTESTVEELLQVV